MTTDDPREALTPDIPAGGFGERELIENLVHLLVIGAQDEAETVENIVRYTLAARQDEPSPALRLDALREAIHRVICDRPPGFSKHAAGNGARCQLTDPRMDDELVRAYEGNR